MFELIAWEDDSWDWAAPMIGHYVDQLRDKYPNLDIVLVSHGHELFDLAKRANKGELESIQKLESLSKDNVDIHVCGNFASTKFLGPEDFLPFVDVAASGPAQLEDYINLGFTPILLERPHGLD